MMSKGRSAQVGVVTLEELLQGGVACSILGAKVDLVAIIWDVFVGAAHVRHVVLLQILEKYTVNIHNRIYQKENIFCNSKVTFNM